MNETNLVIDVNHLKKSFKGKVAVDDLSLQVKKGEIFGFLGPNGSGKTTTIRMMCGLLIPDSGEGTCLGYDILHQSDQIKRHVGYMTQSFSFWNDLSIRENLDFVTRMYSMSNRKQVVNDSLEALGLKDRADQLAGQLSGGWKQRLALAACMIHSPELLLLDEPTAGVDPKARRDFWEEIHRLASKGISVLVSTHYMDEAERCHKLAYISFGKLLVKGTPSDIIKQQALSTWLISGEDLTLLSEQLQGMEGVEQTILFGTTLHVTGKNEESLEKSVYKVTKGTSLHAEKIPTGLEDVFIHLMENEHPQRKKS